jgi:uncharacterized glyoxalase superfamily protein PhnB
MTVAGGELTPFEMHGMQPVLGVRNVEAAVSYYRDKLGFHVDFVEGEPPVHARVCADPSYSAPTIHIRFEPLAAGATNTGSVYLWLHVGRNLDALFELYRSRDVNIVEEPSDRPWGLRQFTIEDCDGYQITICAELDTN